jgi:hypothetical protein
MSIAEFLYLYHCVKHKEQAINSFAAFRCLGYLITIFLVGFRQVIYFIVTTCLLMMFISLPQTFE